MMDKQNSTLSRRALVQGLAVAPAAAVGLVTAAAAATPEVAGLNRDKLLFAYSEWLHLERRMLAREMFPDWSAADDFVPCNTGACSFYFPHGQDWRQVPQPSTRAAAVLSAVGLDFGEVSHGIHDGPLKLGTEASDVTLLRLGRELKAAWAEHRAVAKAIEGDESEEAEARLDAAIGVCGDIVDQICDVPALSLEGLRVKAMALSWYQDGEFEPAKMADSAFAVSIVKDLLRMGDPI
jgi:hypothetical protein